MNSSDAISSTLTPAREGGRYFSHSHRPEELLEASFVSAWDLYLERLARDLTLIGSSDEPGLLPEPCVCACVRVCAIPREEGLHTASSMIVPKEGSQ
jgi:hypothetical protein